MKMYVVILFLITVIERMSPGIKLSIRIISQCFMFPNKRGLGNLNTNETVNGEGTYLDW